MKNRGVLHSILCVFACIHCYAQEITADSIKILNDTAFELARDYSFGKALSYSYIAIQHATVNEDRNSLASSYHIVASTYRRMQYRGKAKKILLESIGYSQRFRQ